MADVKELNELFKACTVRLVCQTNAGTTTGTGFFVAPRRVLTCGHVVHEANAIKAFWRGECFAGSVFASSHPNGPDLALVVLAKHLDHPCCLLEDGYPKVGEVLTAFGYTGDYSEGDIASFECEGGSNHPRDGFLLKTKAGQAYPGMSGGPLVSQTSGRVCGVMATERQQTATGGARALPIETAYAQWPELRSAQAHLGALGDQWLRVLPTAERDIDANLLNDHLARVQNDFLAHMSAVSQGTAEEVASRYMELLVRDWRVSINPARPLSDYLEQPGARLLVFGESGAGKTTLLRRLAADAAARAKADSTAPVPIYIELNFFDSKERGFDELMQIVSRASHLDEREIRAQWLNDKNPRAFLFLMDAFNEVPDCFHEACAVALREFMQKNPHRYVVTSRPTDQAERLANQIKGIKTVEIVQLDESQIEQFLACHGAAGLYSRMGDHLKGLARNPFMLWALAQSCSELPQGALPLNRGQLYQHFVDHYVFEVREKNKIPSPTEYEYSLVKQPILANLARTMTEQGIARCKEDLSLYAMVRDQLHAIRTQQQGLVEVTPYELMPDPPAAKPLLREIVNNGVLRRVDGSLEFMHLSIRDYFAATALKHLPIQECVELVPNARWTLSNQAVNECRSLLFDSMILLSGMLEDSGALIESLMQRDPLLAAECFGGRLQASADTEEKLLRAFLGNLTSDDPIQRALAAQCLGTLGSCRDSVVQTLENVMSVDDAQAVRVAALDALYKLRPKNALRLLIRATINNSNSAIRIAACVCAVDLVSPVRDDDLIMGLAMVAASDAPSKTIVALAAVLENDLTEEELIELVVREPNTEREAALLLLRLTRPGEATKRLGDLAQDRLQPQPVRLLAIRMLPLLPISDSTVQTLLAVSRSSDDEKVVQMMAAYMLGKVMVLLELSFKSRFDKPIARKQISELTEILRRMISDEGMSAEVRVGAMLALITAGNETDFFAILTRIQDPSEDPDLRVLLIETIMMALNSALPFWIYPLPDPVWVSDRDRKLEASFIELALKDRNEAIRVAAATALQDHFSAEQRFLEALCRKEEAPEVRKAAAMALAFMTAQAAHSRLSEILCDESESPHLRCETARALVELCAEDSFETLLEAALSSKSMEVRIIASAGAYCVCPAETVSQLHATVLDTHLSPERRLSALQGIAAIAGESQEQAAESLVSVILGVQEDELRCEAAFLSAEIQVDITGQLDAVFLNPAEDPKTREAAAIGLAFTMSEQARMTLQRVSKQIEDRFAAGTAAFALSLAEKSSQQGLELSERSRVIRRAIAHYSVSN